jgi:phosphoglycolate phosphatase
MEKKKLVIFDFDGVIINTLEFQYGLNEPLNPHITYKMYKDMSNGNFFDSFQGENAIVTLNPNPLFRELYHAKVREFDTPAAIQQAIKKFSKDCSVAVVSSGSEDSIRHFLEKEDLLQCFSDILGYQTHTSKVVKIKGLLEKHNLASHDAVFITDTLGDIREGTEVGIRTIGVTWGMHDRATLEKGNPAIVIDSTEDLERTVEAILNS